MSYPEISYHPQLYKANQIHPNNFTSIDLSDSDVCSNPFTGGQITHANPFDDVENIRRQQIMQRSPNTHKETVSSRNVPHNTLPWLSTPYEFKKRFEIQRKARLGAKAARQQMRNRQRNGNGEFLVSIPIRSTVGPLVATTASSTSKMSLCRSHRYFLFTIGFLIVCLLVPLFGTLGHFWSIQFKRKPYTGSIQSAIFTSGFLLLGALTIALVALHYANNLDDECFALTQSWRHCFKWTHSIMLVCCVFSIGVWLGMYNDVENAETRVGSLGIHSIYLPYKMQARWFVSLLLLLFTSRY